MPEKDPNTYLSIQYAWVLLLSSVGAIVSFAAKVKRGETRWLNLMELVGEICTSGFVGALTFLACEGAGISQIWSAVLVGISAHMGTRAIYMAEQAAQGFADKRLGK